MLGGLTLDAPVVAPLLEQAVDASFYVLTLPKQLNDLGVGGVKLQSSLFSSHIWSDENSNLYDKNYYFIILYSHVFYYYPI